MKYNVAVLMSTYNGEKYIQEQINSLLSQINVNLQIFIRDDMSSDATKKIIEDYKDSRIHLINSSERFGVGKSFMELVYFVKDEFDFYCFADQDDIWEPCKIINAITQILKDENNLLYVSNQKLVDANDTYMGMRYNSVLIPNYKQILCNNLFAGCTMLWTDKLQKLLIDPNRHPSNDLLDKRIHDVWVSMVASVCGNIIYDENSYIRYRQHENNVVGVRIESRFKTYIKKIKNPNLRNGRSFLAREIYLKFNDMITDDVKEFLYCCSQYMNDKKEKKKLLKDKTIIKYSGESKFQFRLKVKLKLF